MFSGSHLVGSWWGTCPVHGPLGIRSSAWGGFLMVINSLLWPHGLWVYTNHTAVQAPGLSTPLGFCWFSLSGDLSTLSSEPHMPLCSSVVFLSQREGCCFSKILVFYFFVFGCAGSLLLHRLFSSWSEWGPLSSCCASHCGGFSYFRAQALSLWAQKLWLPGSTPRLSDPAQGQ